MPHRPSPNFEDRKNGLTPRYIVLHGTWTGDIETSLNFLTDSAPPEGLSRVSAHYLIDANGDVYDMVDENKRAWHAGAGNWRGVEDMNSASIGIEIQNAGPQEPYTDAQIGALIPLLKDIMQRHGIAAENIIAHSDFAPARKDDPGAHFPWRKLAEAGAAIWPDEAKAPQDMVEALLASDEALHNALCGWGYDAALDLATIRTAFDRHFVPEAFTSDADTLRAQRLAVLWQQKLGN